MSQHLGALGSGYALPRIRPRDLTNTGQVPERRINLHGVTGKELIQHDHDTLEDRLANMIRSQIHPVAELIAIPAHDNPRLRKSPGLHECAYLLHPGAGSFPFLGICFSFWSHRVKVNHQPAHTSYVLLGNAESPIQS